MSELMGVISPAAGRSIERVARTWRAAAGYTSYCPLPNAEIRERFEDLAAAAIDALRQNEATEAIRQRGRLIGRGLVELNLLKPEALERTLICLNGELAGIAPPERLQYLLTGIAGGFVDANQLALLAQQEAIRRAANFALQTAQADLAASRDNLRAVNLELSEQVAERSRAEEIQRDLAERLQRLHAIELAILAAGSLATILDLTIEHLVSLIPAVSISITGIDVATKQSTILRNTNPVYPVGRELPITMVEALDRLGEGEIIYIPDISAVPDPSPGVVEIVDLGGRSMLAVPMRYHDSLIGGIVIFLDHVREFTPTEKAVVLELAGSVTVAIQNRQLLEAEQASRRRETSLREIVAALTTGLGLDDLLNHILNHLDRAIASYSSAILLIEDGAVRVVAQRGVPGGSKHLDHLIKTQPLSVSIVIETARPMIINDTHASPDWEIIQGMEYIRSWMAVPLLVKGKMIGILTIDRDQANSFSDDDLETVVTFANQAAIAIDNARLFAREQAYARKLEGHVKQRTRDLEMLYSLTAAAVENHDMDSLLRQCVMLADNAFGSAAAAIYLTGDEKEGLRLAASSVEDDSRWDKYPNHLNIEDIVARELDETYPFITAPLRARGRMIGILALSYETSDSAVNVDYELLNAIADQIGAAVENIRLHQVARQAAIIEERERLARELHDQVTQSIYSAGLFAEAARGAAESEDIGRLKHHLNSTLRMTNQALRELRLLLFEFRTDSLARDGLIEALRRRVHTVEERAGIMADVHAPNVGELPLAIEETFYRIALEALNNSLRHAQADRVEIIFLVEDGDLIMTIVDNGVGFDREVAAQSGGMGLEGMQKRISKIGGVLAISSNESGTWVTARASLAR